MTECLESMDAGICSKGEVSLRTAPNIYVTGTGLNHLNDSYILIGWEEVNLIDGSSPPDADFKVSGDLLTKATFSIVRKGKEATN